jgi:hypothetical protein
MIAYAIVSMIAYAIVSMIAYAIPGGRNAAAHSFRLITVIEKHLPHQLAHSFVAALMEYQDRRPGPAERAAQKTGRTQVDYLAQTRNQGTTVGLMHPILQRQRECAGGATGEGSDQERASLDIEDRVSFRICFRQHSA